MRFDNPWMLLGTLAAAIPVIIHLINRHRARVRPFAAVEFLLLSDKRLARRLRVRQLLVLALRVLLMLAGVLLNGVATAAYIGAQLGPGPRDGLMTGWVRRTGLSVRLVRTTLEVIVVALGWLLGGVVGLGTLLYAVAIGPLTQRLLPHLTVPLSPGPPSLTPSTTTR